MQQYGGKLSLNLCKEEVKTKMFLFIRLLICLFYWLCFFPVYAEVENAKWGLKGGQAHNISTIHPQWNPFSHSLCHPLC